MSKKNRSALLQWVVDIVVMAVAAVIFSVGAVCFISPNDIAPGGGTGIAIILGELTGLSLGTLIALVNVPLIVAGFIWLNRRIMIKTLISVAMITVMTDYVFADLPEYRADGGNGILAALFGGALLGAGVGFTYLREATSGGTDIVAKILNRYQPHLTLGRLQLITDAVVIAVGYAVFRDLDSALYAIVSVFVQSKVVDMLVYGGQECRFLLVFSERPREIADRLLKGDKGVTLLSAQGAYSGASQQVVATAVYKNDYARVKRIIRETDPAAFVVTTGASEVLGEGFQKLI